MRQPLPFLVAALAALALAVVAVTPTGSMPPFPSGSMPSGSMPPYPSGSMPPYPSGSMPPFPSGSMPGSMPGPGPGPAPGPGSAGSGDGHKCPDTPDSVKDAYDMGDGSCANDCAKRFCECRDGAGATPKDGDGIQCRGGSGTNCSAIPRCVEDLFLRAAIGALGGKRDGFAGGPLEAACKAAACGLVGSVIGSCTGLDEAHFSHVCVVPLMKRGALRLRGNWKVVLDDAAARASLALSLTRDLALRFGVQDVVVDVQLASARRAAGDLDVGFVVPLAQIAGSTTFEAQIAAIKQDNSTSWLSNTLHVYTSSGGSESDVSIAAIADATPDAQGNPPTTAAPDGSDDSSAMGNGAAPGASRAAVLAALASAAVAALLL